MRWSDSVLLLFIFLLFFGCANQKSNIPEKHFNSSEIYKIQENVTSFDNVILLLGNPSLDNRDNIGNGQLLYVYKVDEGKVVKTKSLRLLFVGNIVKKCNYTEHMETDGGSTTNNSSGKLIPFKFIPF
jgi:hypothetical protein